MMNSLQQFHFPPREGFVLTHVLVVADQDRSRDYYQSVLGAQALRDRDPVILQLANSWLILNTGGGRTADKPTVTLTTPPDPDTVSAFMNIRVADIVSAHRECCARGAQFLTDPVDHGYEIRGFIRDPDGSSRVANCMLASLREWQ
jgi:catechol 2,3-dioxygenase-like lactoylglutathione lyase family enzyme